MSLRVACGRLPMSTRRQLSADPVPDLNDSMRSLNCGGIAIDGNERLAFVEKCKVEDSAALRGRGRHELPSEGVPHADLAITRRRQEQSPVRIESQCAEVVE